MQLKNLQPIQIWLEASEKVASSLQLLQVDKVG